MLAKYWIVSKSFKTENTRNWNKSW